jgi:hypothetical protein
MFLFQVVKTAERKDPRTQATDSLDDIWQRFKLKGTPMEMLNKIQDVQKRWADETRAFDGEIKTKLKDPKGMTTDEYYDLQCKAASIDKRHSSEITNIVESYVPRKFLKNLAIIGAGMESGGMLGLVFSSALATPATSLMVLAVPVMLIAAFRGSTRHKPFNEIVTELENTGLAKDRAYMPDGQVGFAYDKVKTAGFQNGDVVLVTNLKRNRNPIEGSQSLNVITDEGEYWRIKVSNSKGKIGRIKNNKEIMKIVPRETVLTAHLPDSKDGSKTIPITGVVTYINVKSQTMEIKDDKTGETVKVDLKKARIEQEIGIRNRTEFY